MSRIQSNWVPVGRRSALRRGTARSKTVRSIEYSIQGSAMTARPIHSRRVALPGDSSRIRSSHEGTVSLKRHVTAKGSPHASSGGAGGGAMDGNSRLLNEVQPFMRLISVQVGRPALHPVSHQDIEDEQPAGEPRMFLSAIAKQGVTGPIALSPLGLAGDQVQDTRVH